MTSRDYQVASRHLLLPASSIRRRKRAGAQPDRWLKSIAERREWQHRNHAALFTAVSRLVNETGDEDISLLFAAANNLHVNFYENWEEADTVGRHLAAVERLLDKLEPLLWDERE